MKYLIKTVALLTVVQVAYGQAVLPTSWNFDDPQPTGWSEDLSANPGNIRYTNGLLGAACRLDGDDEYAIVHYSDVAATVIYNIKGQGAALTDDVFTIEESADGSNWTTLRELVGSDIDNNSFVEYTDIPSITSRYIRFYFTEKQSGRNIALDEINLEPMAATNAAEIAISAEGDPVVNNSTFIVGNNPSSEFEIENVNLSGGDVLNVTDAQITGPDAGDFALNGLSTPVAVGAATSITFDLDFSTVGTGSRFATLTLTNDDANGDETTFVIDLYGIGGDFATEPTDQPQNMGFSGSTSYTHAVSFDDATNVPEKYLLLRSVGTPLSGQPADGQTYVKGDYINDAQVVQVGPAAEFTPTYVIASTDYYYAAYSFNGPAGYENYLTASELTGNVTSSGSMAGNFYNGIDPSSGSFLSDVQAAISSPYSQIFYSNYSPIMLSKFASRDTTGGQKVITDVYSGFQYLYTGAFFYDVLSREHSWPHSWMPTYPVQDGMEYSDLHNLFPVHQDNANAIRSNRPFGEVESVASSFMDATYGDDVNGNRVYEPRDQHKGDAARAIFYMATRWNGTGGSWALPDPIDFAVQYGQDQDVLKQWHWQDPPDNWEIALNDFIESEQGNRNPFVDSVNWVCYIDFDDLTYIGQPDFPCMTTPEGIEDVLEGEFNLAPNPTSGQVALNMDLKEGQELTIGLLDVSGRLVMTHTDAFRAGVSKKYFDLSDLDAGLYQFVLNGERGTAVRKLILQ